MDIQVASNFERILFDAYGRDSSALRGLMSSLAQSRRFSLSATALSELRKHFSAGRADEQETAVAMRTMMRETGQFIDRDGAVGSQSLKKKT
jgi:threonine synthase